MGAGVTVAAPWRIAMASSIGPSHIAAMQPCQDSHFHLSFQDSLQRPVMVLVASDGAGSASVADVGATLACQTFARLVAAYIASGGMVETISRLAVTRWLAGVVYRLSLTAQEDGRRLQDYACTLLAAIVGEAATVFVQVGDGAIVIAERGGKGWRHVFWPQHGEFANTTNFVTAGNPHHVVEFASAAEPIDEIAIFTDGIENLVLRKAERTAHAPFFDTMFPAVRRSMVRGPDAALSQALHKYLSGPLITQRTDDDTTLILASRRAR
jgi:hypothetical protein